MSFYLPWGLGGALPVNPPARAHTLSRSGSLWCVTCHRLCLPQSHYFGGQGLTLLFLLSVLLLGRRARALGAARPLLLLGGLVSLVGVGRLRDHARALQGRGVVGRPAARVGGRGRRDGRGRVLTFAQVRDGQGGVAGRRRGRLAVAALFPC